MKKVKIDNPRILRLDPTEVAKYSNSSMLPNTRRLASCARSTTCYMTVQIYGNWISSSSSSEAALDKQLSRYSKLYACNFE